MYRERTTKSKEIGNEPGTERNAQLIKGRNRKDELAREGIRERSIERGNKRERERQRKSNKNINRRKNETIPTILMLYHAPSKQ